jgi:hypothetical protein
VTTTKSRPTLQNRSKTWQFWLAVGLCLLTLFIAIYFIQFVAANNLSVPFVDWVLVLLSAPIFTVIALAIFWFHPDNRIGWLYLVSGTALSHLNLLYLYFDWALLNEVSQPWFPYLLWYFYNFGSLLLLVPLFVLLPALFPSGHFLSPRWRKLTLVLLLLLVFATALLAIAPDFNQDNGFEFSYPLENPMGLSGLPDNWGPFFGRAITILTIGVSLASIASFILRFRRSQGDERQQMKWFAYFLATAVTVQLIVFEVLVVSLRPRLTSSRWISILDTAYEGIVMIVMLGFPLTIGIAVFKYRLYDIDILIRRTLVYGALTVLLGSIYFGGVVLLQQIFSGLTGQADSPLAIVLSTLAIAALFTPLRSRLQAFIDRRFYRQRYDAERTLAAFAAQARDETDLETLSAMLAESVAETMQPTKLSLWLENSEELEIPFFRNALRND